MDVKGMMKKGWLTLLALGICLYFVLVVLCLGLAALAESA
jgi:nitrate reductase NapE component